MNVDFLDDDIIEDLLTCPKRVTNPKARWSVQKSSAQINFNAQSECGTHKFKVYIRQNSKLEFAFSCGLSIETDAGFLTLCRYNGSDHVHRNDIEGEKFAYQCHIHRITKRYIDLGTKPDKYATPTDRYEFLPGAVEAMAKDCNIHGLKLSRFQRNGELFPEDEYSGED